MAQSLSEVATAPGSAANKADKAAKRSELLERIIRYCHYHLNHDKAVLEYFTRSRGLEVETIKKFRLGAFPSLATILRQFSEYELVAAGVAKPVEEGGKIEGVFSKFVHNRAIIPMFDLYGRPVAIMGRTLLPEDEQERLGIPKYDSTVYAKARHLFGLNLAKDEIRKKGAVLVVEGALDVISAYQGGWRNVVGTLGAFLHQRQVGLLARYAERIALGLDRDEAGNAAIARVLKREAVEGVGFSVKQVPEGYKDLDAWFVEKGRVRSR